MDTGILLINSILRYVKGQAIHPNQPPVQVTGEGHQSIHAMFFG
jgi:hypothetical protein